MAISTVEGYSQWDPRDLMGSSENNANYENSKEHSTQNDNIQRLIK